MVYELLQVFMLSMLPIIEQKRTIALGIITFEIEPLQVMFTSLIGSLLPAPFILLFFNKIFWWMKRYKLFTSINKVIDKKVAKNSDRIERNKEIVLIVLIVLGLEKIKIHKYVKYGLIVILVALNLMEVNSYLIKYRAVNTTYNEQMMILEDYNLYSDMYVDDEIRLPFFPVFSIHSGEAINEYHIQAFKNYYNISNDAVLIYEWKQKY